jgi:methylmalonyl-CoA epimerase
MTNVDTYKYNSSENVTIDHIAIAVTDIASSLQWFRDVLGFTLVDQQEIQGRLTGMKIAILKFGSATFVLVQGTTPESQISKFVEENGPGVQHVALKVDDVEAVARSITQRGGQIDTKIVSTGAAKQTFVKRERLSGIMIELIERDDSELSKESITSLFEELEKKNSF